MDNEVLQRIRSIFDGTGISAAIDSLTRYRSAVDKAAASSKGLNKTGNALARISQIASGIVVSRGLLKIGSTFSEGISSAFEFEKAIAEVNTIARNSGRDFEGLADGVREVSDALGIDILDVAEAQYQVLSNQVVSAADSFDFLATASKLATAAVSDNASAVNALSSVLNSFNLPATETEEIADQLFKTVELGRVRLSELGNILGRVTPQSASLGISFKETTAAIASLTQVGIRAAEATTLLSNVQLKLIKPTGALSEVIRDLGAANSEVLIQANGFQGSLEAIANTTGKTAEEFGALFNRARSLRGALTLGAERAENFKDVLSKLGVESKGSLDEAFEKVLATNAKQVEIELNKIKNAFTETFGRATVAAIKTVLDAVGGAEGVLTAMTVAATAAIGALAGFALSAGAATAASFGLAGAIILVEDALAAGILLLSGPAGWAVAAAAAAGAVTFAFLESRKAAERELEAIRKETEETSKAARRVRDIEQQARRESTKRNLSDIQAVLVATKVAAKESEALVSSIQEFGLGGLAEQIEDRIRGFEDLIKALRDAGLEAELAFINAAEVSKDVAQDVDNLQFEDSLRGLSEVEAAFAKIARSEELVIKAQKQIREGDAERGRATQQLAEQEAIAAASALRRSKNEAAFQQIARRRDAVVGNRTRAELEIAAAQERQSKEAAKQLPFFEEQLRLIKEQARRFKELTDQDANIFSTGTLTEAQAREQFGDIGGTLQKLFDEASEKLQILRKANVIDDATLATLSRKFTDSFSGTQGDIAKIFADNFNAAIDAANAGVQKLDPRLLQLLEGRLKVDVAFNLSGAQQQVLALQKKFDQISGNAEKLNEIKGNVDLNVDKLRGDLDAVFNSLSASDGAAVESARSAVRQISQQLSKIEGVDVELLDETQVARVIASAQRLTKVAEDTGVAGAKTTASAFQDTANKLQSAYAEAAVEIDKGSFKTLELLNSQQDVISSFHSQYAEIFDVRKNTLTTEQAITRELQAQALAGGGGAGRFFGGIVRRQAGGPIGQDSVNVMASPGEGFLNAKAMRTFFPQVQAMNAGRRPLAREQGGNVSTPTGDINVTINESRSPAATSDAVIRGINSAQRRNTSRIR